MPVRWWFNSGADLRAFSQADRSVFATFLVYYRAGLSVDLSKITLYDEQTELLRNGY